MNAKGVKKMAKGTIKFEDTTSEALDCTCGNSTMDSGFDIIPKRFPRNLGYACNSCGAQALVDFKNRVVLNTVVDTLEAVR